jgi:3-oxoacyl-[acyl-carrier protein] reductase
MVPVDDLEGRVALVTGASRGIGRGIALELAHTGARIVVNYRREEAKAEEVATAIRNGGGIALVVQADVGNSRDVQRLVETAAAELGSIGILVNNAGIARPQRMDEITEQDWDETVDTNLKSCFLVTQAVLPGMREQRWGRIVNLSSVAAHVGGVVGAHYAASKAGMLGLTHYLANTFVKDGITANAISPALIESDMVSSNPNARPDRIPVGRFGQPDEVAAVVAMLARNGYITGQTIHVNGGWYMT